jgi:lipopolysaccharide transport system permease protein
MLWSARSVLVMLGRKEFRSRYKRATLGVSWAVAMPMLQSVVLIFVFSRVGHFGTGGHYSYAGSVLAGMVPWIFVSTTVATSSLSITEGATLTDKVWFPRALLPLASTLSGGVTLAAGALLLLVELPIVGVGLGWSLLLLVPAVALVFAFCAGIGLLAAAANVYFRDVRFIVQALLVVWIYVTPIVYPQSALHSAGPWLDFNPLTGVVLVWQRASLGVPVGDARAVVVSVVCTLAMLLGTLEVYRRHDRLFVDLL